MRSTLIAPGDAPAWMVLGRDLCETGRGRDRLCFDRAVEIDPKLKEEVDRITGSMPPVRPPPSLRRLSLPARERTRAAASAGGCCSRARVWATLSEAEQAVEIPAERIASGEMAKVRRPLQLRETHYFLLYSDLPAAEAEYWTGLLDRMYGRLADLFGVTRGRNIWRGKAVIFVFVDRADYRRYEREVRGTEPGESAGMTHCFEDGAVKIAFLPPAR